MKKSRLFFSFAVVLVAWLSGPSFGQASDNKGFINAKEFADSQGIAYQWFPMQKTIVLTKGGKVVRLSVGKTDAIVDNRAVRLPSPPRLVNGQVLIPARSVVNFFGSAGGPEPSPGEDIDPDTPAREASAVQPPPVLVAPPRVIPPPTGQPEEEEEEQEEEEAGEGQATLVTVRHSTRPDQTRVVLEFDGAVAFSQESPGTNKFKLRILGCKNLIPTKRSNPAGREISSVSFNSGANRQGLVISFDLKEGVKPPTIETVANPFRMVLTFSPNPETLAKLASATAILPATGSAKIPLAAVSSATAQVASAPAKVASGTVPVKPTPPPILNQPPVTTPPPPPAEPEEVKISVALETLERKTFLGRTIVIDPGHGGAENGIQGAAAEPEKAVMLGIGLKLKQALKEIGFNPVLLRSQDTSIGVNERLALINRAGGDLVISLHAGASMDDSIDGVACFTFDSSGLHYEPEAKGKLSPQSVFQEWCQNTRFDLAKFLAGKVRDRLTKHLSVRDRGVRPLPLLPLKFVLYPAVLVEVGMMTNPTEAKRLCSKDYQEAVARSIANGVVDFFNGIRLTP